MRFFHARFSLCAFLKIPSPPSPLPLPSLLLLPLPSYSLQLFTHLPPPQSVWIHLFYSFVIVLWTDRLRFWILSKHFFSSRNTFFMWILNIYVYISGIFDNCRVNGQIIIMWFFDRNTFPIKSKSGIDKRHFKI